MFYHCFSSHAYVGCVYVVYTQRTTFGSHASVSYCQRSAMIPIWRFAEDIGVHISEFSSFTWYAKFVSQITVGVQGLFGNPVFSLLGAKVWSGNFCSQERKFLGTLVPGSDNTGERNVRLITSYT